MNKKCQNQQLLEKIIGVNTSQSSDNIYPNFILRRIMNSLRKVNNGPYMIDVSITNKCNLFCNFCYANSKQKNETDNLSKSDLKRIFDEFTKLNVMRISITGGEPFLRKDIIDILELATSYKFGVVLNTNATLISELQIKQIKSLNIDRICVSIDSCIKEEHDNIRGDGAFEKAIENIKLMQNNKLPVSILFTATKQNIDSMVDTVQFFNKMNIQYITIMVVCPTGRANEQSLIPSNKWCEQFLALTNIVNNNEVDINVKIVPPNEGDILWSHYYPLDKSSNLELLNVLSKGTSMSDEREISCQAGIKAATVCSNGDIYGCDLMMGIESLKAGNIHKDTFSDIWYKSRVFEELRQMNFSQLTGPCKRCDKKWCGGGCRSAAYNLTGSINGSDMSCYYAKEENYEL